MASGGAHADVPSSSPGRAAPTVRAHVGPFEVVALLDATGPFFAGRRQAFPGAADPDWDRARHLDPAAFGAGGTWLLAFRCFAVLGPQGRVTLVDTGVGPEGSPAARWAPVPGRLPDEMRAAGVDPADVDTVVLTHLHEDHYGWSVDPAGTPVFPNAEYVLQRAELAALGADDTVATYVVNPLRDAGLLREVDGEVRLTGSGEPSGGLITLVPTPGHTPGHQSVLVTGDSARVWVTGDVLVHAVQVVAPAVGYAYESDQDTARRTRTALLEEAAREGALLATAHLTRPFILSTP